MANLWIDDIGAEVESLGAVEAELIEPAAEPAAPPPRTRYTDRPVRPSSNFIAHLMAVDGGSPQAGLGGRAGSSHASAAYRSTVGHAFATPAGRRTWRTS